MRDDWDRKNEVLPLIPKEHYNRSEELLTRGKGRDAMTERQINDIRQNIQGRRTTQGKLLNRHMLRDCLS